MEDKYKIIAFDPLTAPEELWAAHYDHLDVISRELEPEEPLLPREKRRAMLVSAQSVPYANKYYCLMLDGGGRAAGYGHVTAETPRSPTYDTNKAVGNLRMSVLPGCRRKGLGLSLLKHMAALLAGREPEVTELMSPVMTDAGSRFMDALGGKVSLVHGENRLYFRDVDWAMVEAWAAEGALKNPSTSVINTALIPESDIAAYSEIYSETINQQPLGDMGIKMRITPEQIRLGEEKNREAGAEETTIYTKEADGSISGLTETQYMRETGHRVFQMLTGVRAACRGRGLGKMLKALMLLDIRRKYPGVKYVVTGNSDANAPMMGINRALGFKKHRQVLIYKLKLPLAAE